MVIFTSSTASTIPVGFYIYLIASRPRAIKSLPMTRESLQPCSERSYHLAWIPTYHDILCIDWIKETLNLPIHYIAQGAKEFWILTNDCRIFNGIFILFPSHNATEHKMCVQQGNLFIIIIIIYIPSWNTRFTTQNHYVQLSATRVAV